MPTADPRPRILDVKYRPGGAYTLAFTGPAGWLNDATFTATLAGTSLTVTPDEDQLLVSVPAVLTTAHPVSGGAIPFEMSQVGGNVVLVGSWKPSLSGAPSGSTLEFDVVLAGPEVTVEIVVGPVGPGGGGAVETVAAGHGVDVDATDPENPIVAVDETELSVPQANVTGLVSDLAAKQPSDAGLTALVSAGNSAVLASTTAAFTTADETKLDDLPEAATYAADLAGTHRGGTPFVQIGDSLTYGGPVVGALPESQSEFTWGARACGLTGGRARYVGNLGVGGDTTAMILARVDDVLAALPNGGVCTVLGGTNDIATAVPEATTRANYVAIVDGLLSGGVVPVLLSLPPVNDDAFLDAYLRHNLWVASLARKYRLAFVDIYTPMVDPATGNYQAAYTYDGVHLAAPGAVVAADRVAAALMNACPPHAPDLIASTADTTDIVNSGGGVGLFLGTPASGLAAPWAANGAFGAGWTASVVAAEVGNWQRLTGAAAVGTAGIATGFASTGYSPGDRIAIDLRTQTSDGYDGIIQVSVYMVGASAPQQHWVAANWLSTDLSVLTLHDEFTVKAGTTGLFVGLAAAQVAGAVDGWVQFSQVSLRNLTDLDVDA